MENNNLIIYLPSHSGNLWENISSKIEVPLLENTPKIRISYRLQMVTSNYTKITKIVCVKRKVHK